MFGSILKPFPKTEKAFRDCWIFRSKESDKSVSMDINFNNELRSMLQLKEYLQIIDSKMEFVVYYHSKTKGTYKFLLENKENKDIYPNIEFSGDIELIIFELKCCLDNVANFLNLLYFSEIKRSNLYLFQKTIKNVNKPLYDILDKNNDWVKAFSDIRNNITHNHEIKTIFNFDDMESNTKTFDFVIKYLKETHDKFYQMCGEIDELICNRFSWNKSDFPKEKSSSTDDI